MKRWTVLATMTLTGCVVLGSDVTSIGENRYSTTADAHWTGYGKTRAEVLKRAGAFCEAKGKAVNAIDIKDEANRPGTYSTSLIFGCQ